MFDTEYTNMKYLWKMNLPVLISTTKRSCLDKCSNLCVMFSINPFICKCLGLAPRCKQWGPECWINDCYLLCGLLISFVSVAPDCVTAECCDCVSFYAASALTPHHLFYPRFDCGKRAAFQAPMLWAWLPLWCVDMRSLMYKVS